MWPIVQKATGDWLCDAGNLSVCPWHTWSTPGWSQHIKTRCRICRRHITHGRLFGHSAALELLSPPGLQQLSFSLCNYRSVSVKTFDLFWSSACTQESATLWIGDGDVICRNLSSDLEGHRTTMVYWQLRGSATLQPQRCGFLEGSHICLSQPGRPKQEHLALRSLCHYWFRIPSTA